MLNFEHVCVPGMKNKFCQVENKVMTSIKKKVRMSQKLLAECNIIRIASLWKMICNNVEKTWLIIANRKILIDVLFITNGTKHTNLCSVVFPTFTKIL